VVAGLVATKSILWLLPFALGGLMLAGCGGPSDPPESQADISTANSEAAKWTPEQKEAFRQEMKGHALTTGGPSPEAKGKK